MKILFVLTPAFNPVDGGVQRTTFKLGRHFTEQGHEVFYFSLSNEGHVEVKYGQLFHASRAGRSSQPENIRELQVLVACLQPEVVINQMPYEAPLRNCLYQAQKENDFVLLGCLRNSLFNFKSNVRDRMQQTLSPALFKLLDNRLGISFIQLRHRFGHGKDLKAIIDKNDRFVLLAPPNRDELEYFVGSYKPSKVVSIPNSIPVVDWEATEKEKIILHVGRLNIPQKRSDLLLDFWQELAPHLSDWKFIIVGDGPYRAELEKRVEREGIHRVELTGFQDPEHYYKKASVFMMPSAYEGFPNVILEAQSYGVVPTAFNSYAALSWIVNDGTDAIVVQPYNIKKMAERVYKIASTPDMLKRMRENSLKNASRFTIDKVGQQWLDLFRELST